MILKLSFDLRACCVFHAGSETAIKVWQVGSKTVSRQSPGCNEAVAKLWQAGLKAIATLQWGSHEATVEL